MLAFSLILSRQPPGPATITVSPLPPEVEQVNLEMVLRIRLTHGVPKLKRMTPTCNGSKDDTKETTKRKFKCEPAFAPGITSSLDILYELRLLPNN